jgi:hypothetical protein
MIFLKIDQTIKVTSAPKFGQFQSQFFSLCKGIFSEMKFGIEDPVSGEISEVIIDPTGLDHGTGKRGLSWILRGVVTPRCNMRRADDPVDDKVKVVIHFEFSPETYKATGYLNLDPAYEVSRRD